MKKQMSDLAVKYKQKHQDNITRTKASFFNAEWLDEGVCFIEIEKEFKQTSSASPEELRKHR